jgi:4-amino-4-deoxy-L-arabinose transferase-like glycosyltransferase
LRLTLLLLFALHLGLGAAMGLSVDEAHYALYAAHPALSYFDHPPLVGWVQWPLVAMNAPDAVLRLIPGLLWLATVAGVYRLTVRLNPAEGALASTWAVAVLLLAPLLHILAIGLLPDTLLMALTVALMHQTLTLMAPRAATRPLPWLVLGLLLGLAGLSKYTAVFAAAAVAAGLLAAHGLRLLRNPYVYLAALVALVVISPVLVWNAQNQWISFAYQVNHGAGGVWKPLQVVQFLVLQLLAYGPLLVWGLWAAKRLPLPHTRWMLLFFAVPFAVLAYLSGGGSSLPHWTAPAWVALAPFAGMALARAVQSRWRRAVFTLAALQGVLCIALPVLMVTGGLPMVAAQAQTNPAVPNPFADVHGWDQAGARALALASQNSLASVAVQNWTLASRLGWYAKPLPVHVLEDRFNQFDLWAGDLPAGGSTLLVDWSQMAYQIPLGAHGFVNCRLLEKLAISRFGNHLSEFRFYACTGWSANPQPRLQNESPTQ